MAIGVQSTVQQVNQELSSYAIQMRNLMQEIQDFNMSIADLGTAGLEAIGYTATDAPNVVSQAAVLNTMAAVYYGTATQATLFNFNNALSSLWATQ